MIAPLAPDHPLANTVARLLEPIPGDSPGGIDLRFQGYSAIEEARRNENARLPQGVSCGSASKVIPAFLAWAAS